MWGEGKRDMALVKCQSVVDLGKMKWHFWSTLSTLFTVQQQQSFPGNHVFLPDMNELINYRKKNQPFTNLVIYLIRKSEVTMTMKYNPISSFDMRGFVSRCFLFLFHID